jgi:hypothetical protein
VIFARLPYDNESFEKMVGFKYKVGDMQNDLSASAETDQSPSKWNAVYNADNEIV